MNRPKRYLSRDSLCDATVAFDEWIKLFDEKPWIAERIEKLEYDMKLISRMNPYASINYIRRGIGYDDFLVEYAEYRNINKEDLFDILDEIQSGAKGFATYEEWYEHIREYTKQMKLMALSKESDPNAVTLATLHSSKGLEFENVYIIDANEGIMPYKKAVLEKDIEEERRLFYVGMTRAKTSLSVYSVKSVMINQPKPPGLSVKVKSLDKIIVEMIKYHQTFRHPKAHRICRQQPRTRRRIRCFLFSEDLPRPRNSDTDTLRRSHSRCHFCLTVEELCNPCDLHQKW